MTELGRRWPLAEDLMDTITHAFTLPRVISYCWKLHLHSNSFREMFVLTTYGAMMVSLYICSTLYHLFCLLVTIYPDSGWTTTSRNVLQALDRSFIHLFIAACYTPWLLLQDNGPFAEFVCKAVWICALLSVIAQNIGLQQSERFVVASYLLLGVLPGTFICAYATDTIDFPGIVEGGALYITGLLFYFAEGRLPFAHAIWHMFVNAGTLVHYNALNDFLVRERQLAPSNWFTTWNFALFVFGL